MMKISKYDSKYFEMAVNMARSAYELGNYPVGAVLTIDNKLAGKGENKINEKKSYLNHAEMSLFIDYAHLISKAKHKNVKVKVRLYSTLEPCIQCFGASVTNQVDEIYYIVPDPNGGATKMSNNELGLAYKTNWPKVFQIDYSEEPLKMMLNFFRKEISKGNNKWPEKMLNLYRIGY